MTEPPNEGPIAKVTWWLKTHALATSISAPILALSAAAKKVARHRTSEQIQNDGYNADVEDDEETSVSRRKSSRKITSRVHYDNKNYDPRRVTRLYRTGLWSKRAVRSATKIQAAWRGVLCRTGRRRVNVFGPFSVLKLFL